MISSERWVPSGERAMEETTLEARIRSVRTLWQQNYPQASNQFASIARSPSPPNTSRKIRARRRQPRRLGSFTLSPPTQCMALSNQLLCDPAHKFQLDVSRPSPIRDFRRAMGRLSNIPTATKGGSSRPSYRGTQLRYTGACQRPLRCSDKRYGIWWPRENITVLEEKADSSTQQLNIEETIDPENKNNESEEKEENVSTDHSCTTSDNMKQSDTNHENIENQQPSTSASKMEIERKKRLYSTVLSMTPPTPINPMISVRAQKFTPGLIKLNPKIVFSGRNRPLNTDKFEELEKEALEQYKASDESIDTKFRELERQAEEQYTTSNSNTSCSSENSTKTKVLHDTQTQPKKQTTKSHREKSVESVVIYSQNFPDLNTKGRTKSITNLKNLHTPPRGEKKEQNRRMNKATRNTKTETHRAASDTDQDGQETSKGAHKSSTRWTMQGIHPKKRHLSLSVSDLSSDEEGSTLGSIKDARSRIKNHGFKAKMFAHGAGDLERTKKII